MPSVAHARHVAVVGGGIMGLGIAWRCAAAGVRVTLFERETAGAGASSAAAGMLAPFSETDFYEDELLELGRASQERWPGFVAQLQAASGVSVGYDRTGSLVVARDRDEARELERLHAYHRAKDLPVEWLSADAAIEREPLLSPRVVGAVHSPHDHQVDNRAVLQALRRAAEAAGATVLEHEPVHSVEVIGGRVSNVETARRQTPVTDVVVASGAWSRSLRGLPLAPPVRPVKGQMLALAADPELQLGHVIRSNDTYIAPKVDRWIVGATSEDRGFDDRVTAGGVFLLLEGAHEIVPALAELELLDTWAGFRPASRDNGPILGGCDIDGLWFCTGHYRNGIQQAPISIEAVSAAILGGTPPAETLPFALSRFRS